MKISSFATLPILIAVTSAAQDHPNSQDAPRHFRWSERTAHELNYRHTIRTATDLSPIEKKALLEIIEASIRRINREDKEFERMSSREVRELAENTRVELTDLTGSGSRNVIAQANGLGPCGGTGNCLFWIFEIKSQEPRLLLDSSRKGGAFEVITVRPWRTNGYSDLVLGSHWSASERGLVSFKYSNGRYEMSSCYEMNWGSGLEQLKSPYIFWSACQK